MKYTKEFYNRKYKTFETYLEIERRKQVVESANDCKHDTILDVGPGLLPYYEHIEGWSEYVAVDPNKEFLENMPDSVTSIHSTLEDVDLTRTFDFIIISGVLQVVDDQDRFLKKIKTLSHKDTLIHINVSNGQSFHRLLGLHMGMLKNVEQKSEQDIAHGHGVTFTQASLITILNQNGFYTHNAKTYMMKPFADHQMSTIITKDIAHGLQKMSIYFNRYGSEIALEAKIV